MEKQTQERFIYGWNNKSISIILFIIMCMSLLLSVSCSTLKHIDKEKVEIYISEEPMNNGEKWIIYFYEDFTCVEQTFSGIWYGVYNIFEEDSNEFYLSRCCIDDLGLYTCVGKEIENDSLNNNHVEMYDYVGNILPIKEIIFRDSNSNIIYSYYHAGDSGTIDTVIPKGTKNIYADAGKFFLSGKYENYKKGNVVFHLAPTMCISLRFSDNFDTLYYKSPNFNDGVKRLIRVSELSLDVEFFGNARSYIYTNKRKNFLLKARNKKHQSFKERRKADKALLKRKEIYNYSK